MKQCIAAFLLLFLVTSCQKIYEDQQESADEETIFADPYMAEPEFPGGMHAWQQFLRQHLTYPAAAVDADIQGAVMVKFIVCEDGTVCNIEAIQGPEELRQCAVDVIKRSPKWNPAGMDGRKIKSYKKQPIIFRLEEE
jgi:protein TonB